jgi:hypothetical protein
MDQTASTGSAFNKSLASAFNHYKTDLKTNGTHGLVKDFNRGSQEEIGSMLDSSVGINSIARNRNHH